MNALKPFVFVAVLAGIGYGVYCRLNSAPDAPPPDAASGWETGPKIQMPGEASDPTKWAASPPAGSAVPGLGAFSPGNPGAASTGNPVNSAPPFQGQSNGGTDPFRAQSQGPASYPPNADFAAQGSDPRFNPTGPADPNSNPNNGTPGGAASISSSPTFAAAFQAARQELDADHLTEVLQQLSIWYDDPRLAPAEQQQLTELLDQVAGTVIYSTQHRLEPPYEVQPGEQLEDIAKRHCVPWQLLAKINGIDDPLSLRPGERLKLVRGPFSAVISLDQRQLTLMLNGAYAGRFPIALGRDHPAVEGQYSVANKVTNPMYHGLDRAMDRDDPANPLGERMIELGDSLSIHGTDNPANLDPQNPVRNELRGCVSMTPRDVDDVFDILSLGSKVFIRR